MGDYIKAFQGVFAQHHDRYNCQFDLEFGNLDPAEKFDGKMLPLLFRCYWVSCDADIEVVDGLTSYSDAEIEDNILQKQSVVFGYGGCGLIGNFVLGEGDLEDLENVLGFEVELKFLLSSIIAPSQPFVQLRLTEVVDGKLVLGETFWTAVGADITCQMLAGGGLEAIAFRGIKGYLPGMEPQE